MKNFHSVDLINFSKLLKAYQPVYEQKDTNFADRRLDWRAKALKGEEMSVNLTWLCELVFSIT